MSDGPTILIIEARFYEEIADSLGDSASNILYQNGYAIERLAVPGVFEIPAALNMAWSSELYEGCISLGCVIRGETDHYDHICREVSRALMDLSVQKEIPHGFGILTCETREQADVRADASQKDAGGKAAHACLRMIEIFSQS